MSTVRCVECVHFSLRDAPPELARHGLGLCRASRDGASWRYLSARYSHGCKLWARTAAEIVEKRLEWLMQAWEYNKPETE